MFETVYAKSIVKDLRKIVPQQLLSLKEGIEESFFGGLQAAYR